LDRRRHDGIEKGSTDVECRRTGHAAPLALTLVGAAGAIVLAISVAADSDVAAIIGGIALAAGLLATTIVSHMDVDYPIFRRLDNLEK
jgi:hypothetical protein